MKNILFFLLFSVALYAQEAETAEKPFMPELKSFQESDPNALPITTAMIDQLCEWNWAAFKFESFNRGLFYRTQVPFVVDFDKDGTFYQGGIKGTWELVNKKFIKINYEKGHVVGGYYVIAAATKDGIVLSKQLTSTNDMRFNYYLTTMEYIKKQIAEGNESIKFNRGD